MVKFTGFCKERFFRLKISKAANLDVFSTV